MVQCQVLNRKHETNFDDRNDSVMTAENLRQQICGEYELECVYKVLLHHTKSCYTMQPIKKALGIFRELTTTTTSRSQSSFLGPAFRVQKSYNNLSQNVSAYQRSETAWQCQARNYKTCQ